MPIAMPLTTTMPAAADLAAEPRAPARARSCSGAGRRRSSRRPRPGARRAAPNRRGRRATAGGSPSVGERRRVGGVVAAARPGARAGDRRAHPSGVPGCGPRQELARAASAPMHRAKSSFERREELVARLPDVSLDRVLDVAGERADQPGAPAGSRRRPAAARSPVTIPAARAEGAPREMCSVVMRSAPARSAIVRASRRHRSQPRALRPSRAWPRVQQSPRLAHRARSRGAARRASSRRWRGPGPSRALLAPGVPMTRSRTAAEPSTSSAASSSGGGRVDRQRDVDPVGERAAELRR